MPVNVLCSEELKLLKSGLDASEIEDGDRFRPRPTTLSSLIRARGGELDLDVGLGSEIRKLFSINLPADERRTALDFIEGSTNRASVFAVGN